MGECFCKAQAYMGTVIVSYMKMISQKGAQKKTTQDMARRCFDAFAYFIYIYIKCSYSSSFLHIYNTIVLLCIMCVYTVQNLYTNKKRIKNVRTYIFIFIYENLKMSKN